MNGRGFGFLQNIIEGIIGGFSGNWLFGTIDIHMAPGMLLGAGNTVDKGAVG